MASRRGRFLLTAVLLSVAVHIAAALLVVFLPRVLPHEAPPQEQGTIELLMVEQKGAAPSQNGQPSQTEPAPPEQKPAAPSVEASRTEAQAPPPNANPSPSVPENGPENAGEPVPPAPAQVPPEPATADSKSAPKLSEAQPVARLPPAPASREAPVFNLEGTESDSNAVALGSRILPAMPDNRFRNRPPAYPVEAVMRGEHGEVVVLIHVAENGLATSAEVVESSGVQVLDQAAVTAVRKWRFRPAMQAGRAIPFDMPFRFIFNPY